MTNEKNETFHPEIFSWFNIAYIIYFYFLVAQKTKTISYQYLVFRFSQLFQKYKMVCIPFYIYHLFFDR